MTKHRNADRLGSSDLRTLERRASVGRQRCAAAIEPLEPRRLLAAGDLDRTFSGDGKASADLGANHIGAATAVQSDGKVLVAGSANGDAIVLRYNVNGSLDATFGSGGVAKVSLGGTERFNDLALLGDGRIIAGGAASASQWLLVRFERNGQLDTNSGFGGTDGIQTGAGTIEKLALQGTKIITAGGDFVRRHTAAGTIDTTFGSGGSRAIAGSTILGHFDVEDLAVGPDGKIAVSGETLSQYNPEGFDGGALVRLTSGGAIDTSFSGDGLVPLGNYPFDVAGPIVIQPDNRIISVHNEEGTASVERWNRDGTWDGSFGGTVAWGPTESEFVHDMALQPNGQVVLVGSAVIEVDEATESTKRAAVIARLTLSGKLDAGFSGDGRASIVDGGRARGVAIAPNGGIVMAGDRSDFLFVARFQGGGTLDRIYREYGTIYVDGTGGNDRIDVRFSGSSFLVSLNGVTESFAAGSVAGFALSGAAGNDTIAASGLTDAGKQWWSIDMYGGDGADSIVWQGRANDRLELQPDVENAQMNTGSLVGNDLANRLTITGAGTISGEGGNDTLVASAPGYANTYSGGGGNDTLDYSARTGGVRVTLGTTADDGAPGEGDNAWHDIETVNGGAGNDWIAATASNNVLRGNGGNDTLVGFGGNDALFGGSGNDRIYAGSGNDYVEGNSGNDTMYGESGFDRLLGHDGNDYFYVRDGAADTVDGGAGFDRAQRDAIDSVLGIDAFIA